MTVYDLVVIAGTLNEAQAECERWARRGTVRWAAIRPDMIRHFTDVAARDVKVLDGVKLTTADYEAIDGLMARAKEQKHAL